MCGNTCAKGLVCAGTCRPMTIDAMLDSDCMLLRSIDRTTTCIDLCAAVGKGCNNTAGSAIEFWADNACASTNTYVVACDADASYANGMKSFACGCSN